MVDVVSGAASEIFFFFSLEIRRTWTGSQWTCPRPRPAVNGCEMFFAHAREFICKQNKLSIKKKSSRAKWQS